MIAFFRDLMPLLPSRTRRRLLVSLVLTTVLAGLEAGGLLLIAPMVQILNSSTGDALPGSARLVSDVTGIRNPDSVAVTIAVLVGITFVVKSIVAIVLLRWNVTTFLTDEADLSRRVLEAFMRAPLDVQRRFPTAGLTRSCLVSIGTVFGGALPWSTAAVADAISIVLIAVVLVAGNPIGSAAAGGFFFLAALAYLRLIRRPASKAAEVQHHVIPVFYDSVGQASRTAKQISLLQREDYFPERLHTAKMDSMAAFRTLSVLGQAPRYFLELVFIGAAAVVAWVSFTVRERDAAVAALGLFLVAGFRLIPPMNRLMSGVTIVRQSRPSLDQVRADLALFEEAAAVRTHDGTDRPVTDPTVRSQPMGEITGAVRLDAVTYAYPEAEKPAVRGVSLDVPAGGFIGLVGPSGSGKSTLLDLIMGFVDPSDGIALVDGLPMALMRDLWRPAIGYVPQEVVLVDGSLASNIAFARRPEEIDLDAVRRACALAQLDDVVASLPDGLDTDVGENGNRLSGGQRQRVGLARALYGAPQVLVLDEATSQLDVETESRISDAINGLRGRLTIIAVAHRLSTVRACDCLYVMEDGIVTASGTLTHLYETVPEFARVVALSSPLGADS